MARIGTPLWMVPISELVEQFTEKRSGSVDVFLQTAGGTTEDKSMLGDLCASCGLILNP